MEFVEHLEPELGTLGPLDPETRHVALAVGLDTRRQIRPPSEAMRVCEAIASLAEILRLIAGAVRAMCRSTR